MVISSPQEAKGYYLVAVMIRLAKTSNKPASFLLLLLFLLPLCFGVDTEIILYPTSFFLRAVMKQCPLEVNFTLSKLSDLH
ncbi:hypothetical protein V8F06_010909 [Rhypophila decipiens]